MCMIAEIWVWSLGVWVRTVFGRWEGEKIVDRWDLFFWRANRCQM